MPEIEKSFEEFRQILEKQKVVFASGKTLNIEYRIKQIENIEKLLTNHFDELITALRADYEKPVSEIRLELNFCISVTNHILSNIYQWTKGYPIQTDIMSINAKLSSFPQPYGNVLIIVPWNYPFALFFEPLLGAFSAGNTVIIKTSELVPNVSLKLKELISNYVDREFCSVIVEPECGEMLSQLKFDYVFFTGSSIVGKKVYQSISKNLIPATLELGGACPCYVHYDSNIQRAAQRIAWIKTMNAGQICISVNHVFVHKDIENDFIKELIACLNTFYGPNIKDSPFYGRIVNQHHTERLNNLIENSRGEKIFFGESSIKERFIYPTIIKCDSVSSNLIKNEIFGPILPIYVVENEDEAISIIKENSKPLQIYVFTYSEKIIDNFMNKTISGGLTINETFFTMTCPNLPFGGVGESGFGKYHGIHTFKTFSNYRSIFRENFYIPLSESVIYPPYTEKSLKIMEAISAKKYSKLCGII